MALEHDEEHFEIPGPALDSSTSLRTGSIMHPIGLPMRKGETVEFMTKEMSYSYQGRILIDMSGIDLSCNKLTGEIRFQIGKFIEIRALNLSHNNLTGAIHSTFSNLKQMESLYLSHNNLNGRIPP
ncbi:hypothetical protein LWI29_015306 [Acer saccharum]|uniref:Uncharacterized protein n=1 Tax=Acer saccharum TaxID=4024 RepID=A0AA39VY09_ACESA|nr:hypothetical protein LWI29_015306 [Acer saccharum]